MDAYQTIASNLIEACPPAFSEAWLTAVVDDDHTSVQYWCKSGEVVEQPEVGSLAAFDIGDALIALKTTPPYNASPWSRCTFRVSKDGKFDFEVEYDD